MVDIKFFTYFFTLFSICSIWLFEIPRLPLILSIVAVVLGLISDNIDFSGALTIGWFFSICYLYYKPVHGKFLTVAAWTLILITAFFMRLHITGFHNWQIVDAELISTQAYEYSLWLNIDTAFVGLGILLFGLQQPIRRWLHVKHMLLKMLPSSVMAVGIIIGIAVAFHVVSPDAKWPELWLIWIVINLVITCISEEAFFRFFIQGSIAELLHKYKAGPFIAIFIANIFYLLAHHTMLGMTNYIAATFVAGLFYGYVFHITKRIEASILLHFIVNVIHFFFFTYPMLKPDYGL